MNDHASKVLNDGKKPKNYRSLKVEFIECNWQRGPVMYEDKGSSKWNKYIIPLFVKKPYNSFKYMNKTAYHDKYGRWVIHF
jgi:hypothetical protein